MTTEKVCRYFLQYILAVLLVTSLGCESCQKKSATGENTAGNSEAASVNGISLSSAELNDLHKRATEQFTRTGRPLSDTLNKSLRGSILRKMIDDEIIRQRAEKDTVKVDRIERVAALEKYKEKMGGAKGFALFLERQNLTEDQVMKSVVADLQRDKLIEKISTLEMPTENEIVTHYRSNERLYTTPEMVHARHILLKLDANEPKEKADLVLKKAQQIFAEASKPDANFQDLVQKHSEGPSVKSGGDLGFFPRGRMAKSFEDLAFSAPLKKAVGPVKTDFGYHIIFVEEKQEPKVASLEQVRDRIIEFIKRNKRARKSEEILSGLRKEAKIVINDSSMTFEEYQQESARAHMNSQGPTTALP